MPWRTVRPVLEKISCTLSCFAAFSRARLAQAVPTYLAIVRRLVFDHLEREGVDVAKLAAAWQRIARAT